VGGEVKSTAEHRIQDTTIIATSQSQAGAWNGLKKKPLS